MCNLATEGLVSVMAIADLLGGAPVLRKEVRSELDLADLIHAGLPTRVVDVVLKSGLLLAGELYELVVPRRTLAHRKEKQQALSPEQSDRLARVAGVTWRARDALGDRDKAARWLR